MTGRQSLKRIREGTDESPERQAQEITPLYRNRDYVIVQAGQTDSAFGSGMSNFALPLLFALECAPAEARNDLAELLGRGRRAGLSPDETECIRRLLASSGALEYATTVADAYWERAMTSLEHVGRGRTAALLDFLTGIRGN